MITISTDKSKLNAEFIHAFLTESYWAKGRTVDEMNKLIENSLCFGVFKDREQIGFSRVLTDTLQFAYIMDVFIDPEFRGKGYSKELVKYMLAHESLCHVKVIRLATLDAHGLYKQFGFRLIKSPEKMMELER